MSKVQVLRWQEIPSLVEARDQNGLKKIQLSEKFQALIDAAAMKRGLAGTDAYLEEWNKSAPEEHEGEADSVVSIVAEEIEAKFNEFQNKVFEATNETTLTR